MAVSKAASSPRKRKTPPKKAPKSRKRTAPAPETLTPPAESPKEPAPALDAGSFTESSPAVESEKLEPEHQEAIRPAQMEPYVSLPFDLWGKPLDDYERKQLAEAWAPVIDKRVGPGPGKYSDEVNALVKTMLAIWPRVRSGEPEEERAGAAGGDEGTREDVSGAAHS
jgi:hypothetical protein